MKTDLEMVVEILCSLNLAGCPGDRAVAVAERMFNNLKKQYSKEKKGEEKINNEQ